MEELDEDFFAFTMRRTLAEEQKGVNAGRNVGIWNDTKRYRGCAYRGKGARIVGVGPSEGVPPACFWPQAWYRLHSCGRVALVS